MFLLLRNSQYLSLQVLTLRDPTDILNIFDCVTKSFGNLLDQIIYLCCMNNIQIFSEGYYVTKKDLFWSIIFKSHETLSHTYRVIPFITFSEKPNTQKQQKAILCHINRDWNHCRICCLVYLRFKTSLNYVSTIASSQSVVKNIKNKFSKNHRYEP